MGHRRTGKVAILTVRRRSTTPGTPLTVLLWSMALFSLFLLPTNVRAGSETTHSHSILQLLIDAHDGQILHHHVDGAIFGQGGNWFDPGISSSTADTGVGSSTSTDLGDRQNSVPVAGGVALILSIGIVLWLVRPIRSQIATTSSRLFGAITRVPAPPPRLAIG